MDRKKLRKQGEKKKSLLVFQLYMCGGNLRADCLYRKYSHASGQNPGLPRPGKRHRRTALWKLPISTGGRSLMTAREGPLPTWVSLGIPNSRCELLGYTGADHGLKNGFYGDGLIKFELDRAYKRGEVVVEFGFTTPGGYALQK